MSFKSSKIAQTETRKGFWAEFERAASSARSFLATMSRTEYDAEDVPIKRACGHVHGTKEDRVPSNGQTESIGIELVLLVHE